MGGWRAARWDTLVMILVGKWGTAPANPLPPTMHVPFLTKSATDVIFWNYLSCYLARKGLSEKTNTDSQ